MGKGVQMASRRPSEHLDEVLLAQDGWAGALHERMFVSASDGYGAPAAAGPQGAPARVRISAPRCAPICAAPRAGWPSASPTVKPAANASPQP